MKFLTAQAMLPCSHESGITNNSPSQHWVTIQGQAVLVEPDPTGWSIKGCTNTVMQQPCLVNARVTAGYSAFIKVNGKSVCLDTLIALTNATPTSGSTVHVRKAGQDFVQGGS